MDQAGYLLPCYSHEGTDASDSNSVYNCNIFLLQWHKAQSMISLYGTGQFFSQCKVRHKKRKFRLFSSCKCLACIKMRVISFSICSASAALRCQTPEVSEGRQNMIYNQVSLCYYLFDPLWIGGGYFKME